MPDSTINGGKSSLLVHRRSNFQIDPKGYVYDEKPKQQNQDMEILRPALASPLFF